jgi:diguanylate cyclase (GGDEF)-like protein/PAS domain S-box-containing protein
MNKSLGRRTRRLRLRTPGGIVLLYAVFAGLWIAVSDRLLTLFFADAERVARIGTLKGFLFIAVTGTLLYLLLKSWHRSLTRAVGATVHYRERMERVLKGSNDGWWDWDVKNDALYFSPRWWEMLGYTANELPFDTRLWQRLTHPDDLKHARRVLAEALRGDAQACTVEKRMRHKDGHYLPILTRYTIQRDPDGTPVHVSGTNMDLSERKQTETQIEFLAHHDSLTQLPNRLLLQSHLEHAIRSAQRESSRLALLILDLDRFKNVNESFGHGAGDELLQQVTQRLTARLRGMDTVARLGGDEFAVMLPNIVHPEDAALVANELMNSLNRPWALSNGAEVRIGVSIGISIFPEHGRTTTDLLQHADAAMYQAKQEGRGRFRYFSQNLTRAARERIELEARLHHAIAQDELRVFYQPQVEIASGRIVGAEALVRWLHPQEGLIPPLRFIPLAEATGLIGAIGEWVLRETCAQGKRWIDAGLPPLTLAVNLSPRQFLHGDFSVSVAAILAQTGFPPNRLEMELTEGALMEQAEDVVQLLARLRAIGVRLAIDDFGTGYSSLAYLKRFPLDVLKIDKSFIDELPHQQGNVAIASAIVAMAHSLGFQVLAEGVENNEQLAFLRSRGCDLYQGYLASKPVPADAFAQLLLAARA